MLSFEKMSREELIATLVASMSACSVEAAAADDAKRLFHDLQVHQIELEMQNRELRESRSELEESRHRYADLYDFAPLAHFTLDAQGIVHDLNLGAAKLLGYERDRIVGRPVLNFAQFATPTAFLAYLARCAVSQTAVVSEFRVRIRDRPFDVEVTSIASSGIQAAANPTTFRSAFADITARKRTEAELELARASEQNLRDHMHQVDQAHSEVACLLAAGTEQPFGAVVEAILVHAMALARAEHAELQLVDGVEFGPDTPQRYSQGAALPVPCAHFSTSLCIGAQGLAVLSIYRSQGGGDDSSAVERLLNMYGERIGSLLEVARLRTLLGGVRA